MLLLLQVKMSNQISFWYLPPEVRNRIYELIVPDHIDLNTPPLIYRRDIRFCRANRQFYNEVMPILYRYLHLTNESTSCSAIQKLNPQCVSYIKSLTVNYMKDNLSDIVELLNMYDLHIYHLHINVTFRLYLITLKSIVSYDKISKDHMISAYMMEAIFTLCGIKSFRILTLHHDDSRSFVDMNSVVKMLQYHKPINNWSYITTGSAMTKFYCE